MRQTFGILLRVLLFCLLTLLTQIGGVAYLLSFTTYKTIGKQARNRFFTTVLKVFSFLIIYTVATFAIVPILAKPFGRVPLPLTSENNIQPLNILTVLLNRNYVVPPLRQNLFEAAKQMNQKHPGTVINYLDANFPFFNHFPLLPHLSHNDGKKLDLSFCYRDTRTKQETNDCPSFIGYGICEEPGAGEHNTAILCANNGYWQYSLLRYMVPQGNKINYSWDAARTRDLVNIFAAQPSISKIFIEPHLKTRLHLKTQKIRFHGCGAVRHDDHIHVEVGVAGDGWWQVAMPTVYGDDICTCLWMAGNYTYQRIR